MIRWGTSSWSDKSWVGSFYPPGTKPADYLPVYATQFDTVEVDATYYGVPAEPMVAGWERKLPDGFVLSGKFPRTIVHGGEDWQPNPARVLVPEAVQEETDLFLERMRLLGEKCGPLVLQFPWFSRRAPLPFEVFLERLDAYLERLPDDLRYAVEVRNRDWLNDALVATLRRHRTALVLSELVNMPHPADVARRLDVWTTDFGYCRLIGDRKATERVSKTFDRVFMDKERELSRWSTLLTDALGTVPVVYVYANNHYAGHGPATIRRLRELVEAG